MKRLWIIVTLAIIICVCLIGCNEINISNNGVKISENGNSEYDGVYMTIESISYHNNHKEINVVWHNDTDYEVYFDSECDIEYNNKGEWVSVKTAEDLLDSMLYPIKPHSTYETSFSTEHYDLSEKGVYRLYSYLNIRGNENQHGSAYVEFEVTSVESHKVTMKDEDWLFEDLKSKYYEGERVTVKINMATDLGYMLLANGERVKQVSYSSGTFWYWEFAFTMPNEDVVLEFKTYDGFLRHPNESELMEAYILANPDIESVRIDSYYGEYESGAIVAIIEAYGEAVNQKNEAIDGFDFRYTDIGGTISVFYNSSFYCLKEAYESGYLTLENMQDIESKHKEFYNKLYNES